MSVISKSEEAAAIRTLRRKGYTYHGGEEWKPPLGPPPDFSARGMVVAPSPSVDAKSENIAHAILVLMFLVPMMLAIVFAAFELHAASFMSFLVGMVFLMLVLSKRDKAGG